LNKTRKKLDIYGKTPAVGLPFLAITMPFLAITREFNGLDETMLASVLAPALFGEVSNDLY
jgi:hypothetical protein